MSDFPSDTRMQLFEPDMLYAHDDPALRPIGTIQTLAEWRGKGEGPAFYQLIGRARAPYRAWYKGSDLNAWIEGQRTETAFSREHKETAKYKLAPLPTHVPTVIVDRPTEAEQQAAGVQWTLVNPKLDAAG